MTRTKDRVRDIVEGKPNDPAFTKAPGWTPPERPLRRLPVVDRDRIVEEVVTRRLVVVDSKGRERVVIGEGPGRDELMIEVVSADGEASFSVDVGIEDSEHESYAYIVATAPRRSVTLHAGAYDCSVEVENVGLGIPSARLTNEALEFKTIH
jgi:hypothetical protein